MMTEQVVGLAVSRPCGSTSRTPNGPGQFNNQMCPYDSRRPAGVPRRLLRGRCVMMRPCGGLGNRQRTSASGKSPASRSAGWVGSRLRTSWRYAKGSMSWCLRVPVKESRTAAVRPTTVHSPGTSSCGVRELGHATSSRRGYSSSHRTAHRPGDSAVRVTHPFHPLCGQALPLLHRGHTGEERRVVLQRPDGSILRVPTEWTDLRAPTAMGM